MKIKLPMVLKLNDQEQRSYSIALNKFIQFDDNEKNIFDINMRNANGISSLNDTVGMLKIGNEFRNYGSNGCFSSDYVYFFNTSIKFDNEDIVKSFLENHRDEFKNIKNVETYIKDVLYSKYTQNIDIQKIVEELESESTFFKIPKSKMKIK